MTDDAKPAVSMAGATRQGQMVATHWARLSLTVDGALQALRSQGIAPEQATADDLHALDMLHMGGLAATDALAEMAHLRPGQRVLDVGAGVGGPARRMARKHGARVWGVELSGAVYQTAVALTALVGLQNQVQFTQGSGLALPFEDGAFDVVVMQHVAMQITEKDQLFGECVRVLKPGGVLALHEIFAGAGGPPLFPLAWATDPAMSSLESLDVCASRLTKRGLTVGPFVDKSEAGRQYHAANIQAWQQAVAQQRGRRDVRSTRRRSDCGPPRRWSATCVKDACRSGWSCVTSDSREYEQACSPPRAEPDKRMQATAHSVRSCLAPAACRAR